MYSVAHYPRTLFNRLKRTVTALRSLPPRRPSGPLPALKRVPLGASPLLVSEVCLGTMTFGSQNSEREAHDIISLSVDSGINFMDTAEIYPVVPAAETQGGTSRILGSWFKKTQTPRDRVVLASKVAGRSTGLKWVPANRTEPRGVEVRRVQPRHPSTTPCPIPFPSTPFFRSASFRCPTVMVMVRR